MNEEAYYIEPVSRDHFHLYNPLNNRCRRATLRGGLKKGPRKEVSLVRGERLTIRKLEGTKKWVIVARSRQEFAGVLDRHDTIEQCDYAD